MYAPGTDPKVFRVKGDIPKPLYEAIEKGLKPIGPECLKANTETCLAVYEDICLKHVLSMQLNCKELRRLMRLDPVLQQQDAYSTSATKGCVSKSSVLGQDPWGDEPLPEPKGHVDNNGAGR